MREDLKAQPRSLRQWAAYYGVHHSTFIQRVRRGLTIEQAGHPARLTQSSGRAVSTDGYFVDGQCRKIHIAKAEAVLGRQLQQGECVHHADGNRLNNDNTNLVICPDQAYHALLHQRMRAMAACGNPGWRKCQFCGQYDSPSKLYIPPKGRGTIHHRECRRAYQQERKSA